MPIAAFVLALACVAYAIARCTTPIPFLDDVTQVRFLTQDALLDRQWLFHLHNEHRIPLPRAIYTGMLRAFGDFRVVVWLDFALIAASVAWLMVRARRLRGRWSVLDASLPLVWFSLGTSENWLNAFQIVFVLPACLVLVFVGVTSTSRDWLRSKAWWTLCVALMSLPLCAGSGVIASVPLAVWLALECAHAWRERLRVRAIVGGVSIAATAAMVVYTLATYTPLDPNAPHPTFARMCSVALQFLAQFTGWPNQDTWPLGAILVVLVAAASTIPIRNGWRRGGIERRSLLALVAVVCATLAMAAGVGAGRGADGELAGTLSRYGTFSMLAPTALWFAWVRFGVGMQRTVALTLSLVIAATIQVANLSGGFRDAEKRLVAEEALRADVRAGLTWSELAARNAVGLGAVEEDLRHALRDLERMRRPPFEHVHERAPTTPFTSFLEAPTKVISNPGITERELPRERASIAPPGSELRFDLAPKVRQFGGRAALPLWSLNGGPHSTPIAEIWFECADAPPKLLQRIELAPIDGSYKIDFEAALPPGEKRAVILRVPRESVGRVAWSLVSWR